MLSQQEQAEHLIALANQKIYFGKHKGVIQVESIRTWNDALNFVPHFHQEIFQFSGG